ncbi:MAG: PAS domain S-box protein [Opitutaceae bacterium]
MTKPLRCLLIEDSEDDAALVARSLRAGGFDLTLIRVDTPEAMRDALNRQSWDIVLSDYRLPRFSGKSALDQLKASGLDLPFIIVSGTIGDEIAAEAMKVGAHDYILKDNLERLVPAVERELRDAAERRRLRQAEAALKDERALFNDLASTIPDHIYFKDLDSRFVRINDAMAKLFGLQHAEEAVGKTDFDFFGEEHARQAYMGEQAVMRTGTPIIGLEEKETWPDGRITWVTTTKVPQRNAEGAVTGLIGISRDITQRKRADAQLRLLSTALSSAANAIVITNRDGIIEWVNASYSTLTGYTSDEAIGHNPRELVKSGKHDDEFYRDLWTTILAGRVWKNEMVNRRKDGSFYSEYQTITPVKDDRGEISHFIAVKENITERKEAETRIRYLNRVYALLSDVNQSIVRERDLMKLFGAACRIAIEKGGFYLAWVGFVDRQANCLNVVASSGAEEAFIRRLPPALGGSPANGAAFAHVFQAGARLVCNDIAYEPRLAELRGEALQLGFRALASIPLHKENEIVGTLNLVAGEAHFFSEEELRLLDELALDISYAIEVHHHETVRRQAEERIREQAHAMDLAPVAITIYDAAGKVTYCNNLSSSLFGFKSPNEMLGLRTEDIFPAEALKAFGPARTQAMETGTWQGEVSFVTRDGRQIVTSHHLSLIKDETGRTKGRLSIAADITEKKQLEAQAYRAQRLENLGMLAAGIAHDFNNALAPITMAAPLLRRQVHDPAGLRMLDIVEQSSARGASLVRQMLSFARGVSGGKQLTQMSHVLREVAALSESSFPKHIRIEAKLPSGLWPILADPTQMNQVFMNLCVNARDAMPKGGTLTIAASNRALDGARAADIPGARAGNFLAVDVRDTGSGIPAEVLERIFDPFFTTKGEGKGTGLGLSTVRAIVSQHDGFLCLRTSTDKDHDPGTTFTVFLPAALGEVPDKPAIRVDPWRRGRGELILLVDDDQAVLDVALKILVEGGGYRVITSLNGADAASLFLPCADEVRLLITDLDMPLVGGIDLTAALRKVRPDLPVIFMTGGRLETDETIRNIANAVLPKPFEVQNLLEVVYRALQAAGSGSPFAPGER